MIARDTHERFEELAVGHALSALEPEDEQLFLRHLATCARCESSLAGHRETLAHLAYAVEPATPPPSILDGIRRGIADGDAGVTSPSAPAAGSAVVSAPVAGPVDELARQRERRHARRGVALTAVAAAVALVVGLGAWNVALRRDNAQQSARSGQLAQAVAALSTGPARTVPLKGANGAASVIAVVRADAVSLVVDGLAPNDTKNSTYVLWGVQGVTPRALSTFDVTSTRLDVVANVPTPADARIVFGAYAITREDGRQAPVTPKHPILVQGLTA